MNSPSTHAEARPKRYKLRSSTKIAIGFALVVAAAWFGVKAYSNYRVAGFRFPDLTPGKINLIAITPGSGYRIVVANGIAQLAETSGSFDSPEIDTGASDLETTNAKKIPLREMLNSLRGESEALDTFVMRINEIREDDIPQGAPRWKAADIEKALGGDGKLKALLERDLGVRLDGRPLEKISPTAVRSGIVVEVPVPIEVTQGDRAKTEVATILDDYQPSLPSEVAKSTEEKFDPDNKQLLGAYLRLGNEIREGKRRPEDVTGSLRARYSAGRVATLKEKPERILRSAIVVLNEDQIESADYRSYTANRRQLNDMTIRVSDEGRNRLWKYSHDRKGFQLLLVVDGVAIAAPRITQELTQREVTINQLPDELLVRDAVDQMNSKTSGGKRT
ncbi:MAG TPA: hypothetical protein PLH94_10610 [Fimbriimonadaceae bacterium]|nr:hypothetical protein [Fimbriimonadaceae bacterium]